MARVYIYIYIYLYACTGVSVYEHKNTRARKATRVKKEKRQGTYPLYFPSTTEPSQEGGVVTQENRYTNVQPLDQANQTQERGIGTTKISAVNFCKKKQQRKKKCVPSEENPPPPPTY